MGRDSENFIPARLRLAYVYYQKQQKDQARQILEELKAQAPDREDIYLTISYFYEEENMWHRAIATLQEGLARLPKSAEIHFRLAILYEKQKDREASIRQIKKVLELDPENADALNFLGYSYAEAGTHLDEAERLIQEALRAKPDSGHIIDSRGGVNCKKGLYDKAVAGL